MRPARCNVRRGPGGWRFWSVALAVLLLVPLAAAPAQTVNGEGGEEIRLLRQARALETSGDLEGAEEVLRTILADRPTSLSGLLGMERLLRMQGRLEEIVPMVDRLLEANPTSAVGHQLMVRTFSTLNDVEGMERAAEAWMQATPQVETPYREIARVWKARGEVARAVEVLERGRERLGNDALALELGDLYAEQGQMERAAREWERAIGPEARGLMLVRRRLNARSDGGARIIPMLVEGLTREPTTPARQKAAAALAIDAGLEEPARRIAAAVLEGMAEAEWDGFLVDVARRADGVRLPHLAYWAYGRLLEVGGPEDRRLAIRNRLAELALVVGDTASARDHYRVIEEAYAVGSAPRRKAAALRIQLTAKDGKLDEALGEFLEFRDQYPDAPELDGMAAVLAGGLLRRGDAEAAENVLQGVRGPRSAVLRSRIAFRRGDVEAARTALLTAAPSLDGAEATRALTLATLLRRLSEESGRVIARAMAHVTEGRPARGVEVLVAAEDVAAGERAAVLDFAADLADRAGLAERSEEIRRIIVTAYPRAQEAPAAFLALARQLARRPDGVAEARELLERLILEHPRSALVPQARRELDRLERRVPNS